MTNPERLATAVDNAFRNLALAERELSRNPSDTALVNFEEALETYTSLTREAMELCNTDTEFASVYVQVYSELTGNG